MDQHLLVVIDAARDALEKAGLNFGARTIVEQIGKRLGLGGETFDFARHEEEIHRIDQTLQSVESEIAMLRRRGCWSDQSAKREDADPGFGDFVAGAFEASADTRDEAKRRLFGRFVAHRLQVETDEQAIALRRALRTTRDLTQVQLVAIAAIVMCFDLGSPESRFVDRGAAEAWLRERYGSVFAYLSPIPWTYDDLSTLGSVGALSGGLQGGAAVVADTHAASPLNQWLAQNGVMAQDDLMTPDMGTREARERYAKAFPTLARLSRLGGGVDVNDDSPKDFRLENFNRLDSLKPTPLGLMIGRIVLEQLCSSPDDEVRSILRLR
jgi:hypothetical protein